MGQEKQFSTDELREMVEHGGIVEIPWRLVQPFRGQPRKHFSRAKLEALKRSIAERGQKTPAKVRVRIGGVSQQFELVDGERRLKACSLLDRPLRAWVVDINDADEQYEESILANFNRADHTPLEIAAAVERIRTSSRITAFPTGEQVSATARTFGRSEAWIHSYLSLARLVPELRRRLEPEVKKKDRLKLALAFRLSTLPRTDQGPEFERIRRKKLSGRQAQRHIDKTILRKGLDKNRRGRKPSDDLDLLVRFLKRTEQDSGDVLALDESEMGRMVAGRDVQQRRVILQELDMARQSLDRIQQRLQQAMKDNPPAAKPN